MKLKTLLFLFICLSLSACKDDDNEPGGNGNRPETQAWIEVLCGNIISGTMKYRLLRN